MESLHLALKVNKVCLIQIKTLNSASAIWTKNDYQNFQLILPFVD